jgi:hypothetical protein
MTFTLRRTAFAALATLSLAACGGSDESGTPNEQAIEEAIESASGGSVDVESDGDGDFSIETEDGSLVVESGGDLPEGFPAEIVFPANWVRTSVSEMSANGTEVFSIAFVTTAGVDEALAEFSANLTANGFTELTSMLSGEGPDRGGFVGWQSSEWSVSVAVGIDEGTTSLAVNVGSL